MDRLRDEGSFTLGSLTANGCLGTLQHVNGERIRLTDISLEELESLTGLVHHVAQAHPEDDEVLELRDKMMGVLRGECEAQGQMMPEICEALEEIERN